MISNEEIKRLADLHGYSNLMMAELIKNYPDDYVEVIKAFEKPLIKAIRVNTLKVTPETVKTALEQKEFKLAPNEWLNYAFNIFSEEAKFDLGATHEYLHGWYYLQTIASMIPVHILFPEPNDTVLDMCAAPGSKTTQIAQYMQNEGIIIAIDDKKNRILSLNANLKRCGVYNCVTFPYNAKNVKKLATAGIKPNKILLDAPCTGAGIIRQDPTRKTSRDLSDIKYMASLQKELLTAGLELLAPQGWLLYSTCSFHYQENEMVISEVLPKFKDVEIVSPAENIGLPGLIKVGNIEFGDQMLKARRLAPNIHDTDAFFYCLLKKQ